MKRFWIGISVLLILLVCGWVTTICISRSYAPISQDLELASQAVLSGNWQLATDYFQKAQAQWQRCRDFTAAFADHSVLEEMEGLFAEVEVYRQVQAQLSFSAACAQLSRMAVAVAESHLPKWQNLL